MTMDLWSDPNRDSYMAVTSHFMMRGEKNRLKYRTCLVAFRYIGGSHSGANLGQEFLKITDELEITIKVNFAAYNLSCQLKANFNSSLVRLLLTMHPIMIHLCWSLKSSWIREAFPSIMLEIV